MEKKVLEKGGRLEAPQQEIRREVLMSVPIEDWMDSNDVQRLLKISKRTLQTLRDTGKLPFSRLGNKILYWKGDIQAILADNYMMNYRLRFGYGATRDRRVS